MRAPEWIASLPMYDFPALRPAHDALWSALAARLEAAGVRDPPRGLTRDIGHPEVWKDPRLLFGQGCEYPLVKSFRGVIRLVATPRYSAPGCEGATYRSAVVVRASDSAGSLADLEHRRCAVNQPDSNSGMNLLRAAIAPLAGGRRFFAGVALSGAHQRSAEMVAGGAADVAALDCVTWAHLGRLYPVLADQLRVLCWTPASASLPFITADSTSDAMLRTLRSVLEDVLADSSLAGVRERLLLTGIDPAPDSSFSGVLALERRAIESGYPTLE